MRRSLATAIVLTGMLLVGMADLALAQRLLQVDWEVASRRGAPRLRGYFVNDHPAGAGNVQLAVETLDASGAVVARTTHVLRSAGEGGGAAYRVTVVSADWFGGGGGP